jgi:hypothetical protein
MISAPSPVAASARRFLRPAGSILATLEVIRRCPTVISLPQHAWNLCRELVRLHSDVQARGWRTATEHVERRIAGSLESLINEARHSARSCSSDSHLHVRTSLRTLVDDLSALTAEFDEVEFDLRKKRLWVETDPIELEGLALGRFRIVLRWSRLGENRPYFLEALDPNEAAGDSSVTHPHVRDDALCEGDGKAAIRAALEEGRLFDFFLLVRQILETYNSSSAYVRIEDWVGVKCVDCGSTTDREEASSCERCDSDLCSDCMSSCSDCGRSSCSECQSHCQGCECDFCRRCLNDCDGCGDAFCINCLTDGMCDTCLETSEEPDEDLEPVAAEATTIAPPDPQVHADGVGQVSLSA